MRLILFVSIFLTYGTTTLAQSLPSCEWCGAMDAPKELTWQTKIANDDEPGERLVLEGIIYHNDGVTPASDILVYAYHTDRNGLYVKKGSETGNGRRHGYLRGWIRTQKDGKYRFDTILPASYPTRTEPAHVHMTLTGPGINEYWINSTLFEGDPLITDEERAKHAKAYEGSGIIELEKRGNSWYGSRDIKLK